MNVFKWTDVLSLFQFQYPKATFILCWKNILHIWRQPESWLYYVVLMQISGKMLFYCNICFPFQTHDVSNIHFLYAVNNIILIIILSFFFSFLLLFLPLSFMVCYIPFTDRYVSQLFWLPGYVYIFCLAVEHTSMTFTTHFCRFTSSFVGPFIWFPTFKIW